MKIKVSDLEANPFRNIGNYPIDRSKVDALKISIKETTFWDNILVRLHPTIKGKYQIAYGHHRHIALKELKLEEVDIPSRKLTDAQMVKIMAEENLQWMTSPAIINETVLATKKFLDTELAKYETWKSTDKSISSLFEDEHGFRRVKAGVGRDTILKFLGGNWKEGMIQNALATLKADKLPVEEGGVDRKAVEVMPNLEAANRFRAEVARHKIPKPIQRKIAKKIVRDGVGSRDVQETIREIAKPEHLDIAKKQPTPTLDKFVENMLNPMRKVQFDLIKIKGNLDDIQSSRIRRQLLRECDDLIKVLNDIKVKERNHVKQTG